MITIPTVKQIAEQIIIDMETKIGQTIPALPKSFIRVLAYAISGVVALLYRFGGWVYKQIFVQTASGQSLTYLGQQFGIVKTAAVPALLECQITGTNGTVVPEGTFWQKDGFVYRQEADATIALGVATIQILAQIAGDAGNQADATVISLVTPQAGLVDKCTVTDTITVGYDQESDELYRARILSRLQFRPQGGASADYVAWALEVPGVVKAFAFSDVVSEVSVYPLMSLTTDRIPDAGELATVQAYLEDTIRRPLCANVTALAMTEIVVNVTVTTLQTDDTKTRTAITNALTTYLQKRYPKQYADENNPTDQLVKSLLVSEAIAAGARVIELDMYLDADVSPTIFYTLAQDEIAILGTITWPS